MHPKFWAGKSVLVTGHTGFKGSWLVYWLAEMGANVAGLALAPNTNPSIFSALNIESRCRHQVLDIRDSKAMDAAIRKINPEIVFHMAAQPLVRLSYSEPIETYATNVMGTLNLLLPLRQCEATRSVVVITTDKCYENREWHWGYRETDALGGHDPYSSSKACAEILTASVRRSFFKPEVPISTVRAGNVIGGGDWSEDRLVPDLVRSQVGGKMLSIRYPEAIRPWQHVLSPLSGYLLLGEAQYMDPKAGSLALNFAPNDEDCVPVRELIEEFGRAWGKPFPWQMIDGPRLHESHFLKLDSSLAKARLGWRPQWDLKQSLKATAEWYRGFYEAPRELEALTRQQISSYCEALG